MLSQFPSKNKMKISDNLSTTEEEDDDFDPPTRAVLLGSGSSLRTGHRPS